MSIFNAANIKKTLNYLKRNGAGATVNAVRERLDSGTGPRYRWEPISDDRLQEQREHFAGGFSEISFSIVVPAYRTDSLYLREMLNSVIKQTYGNWELILADATEDDSVKSIAEAYGDSRIRYYRLPVNGGIADNTNYGIKAAGGDYVGLLDHDDMLTADALYEMAMRIRQGKTEGAAPEMLYSDEDKCSGDGKEFYDPNIKGKFNLDLLLSNNYICHFLVMKRELIKKLMLRKEYDGAQDYDLVLRAAYELGKAGKTGAIAHVPRILYHWRCHTASTAENPQSKLYAYDAGRRAVQDFADRQGWRAKAVETQHRGFYRLQYEDSPLKQRSELGAVGGRLLHRGKTVGGRMNEAGECLYYGLPKSYSGYLHRAVLQQDAEALDIRNIEIAPRLYQAFFEEVGLPYTALPGTGIFDASTLPEGTDYRELSLRLCRRLTREKDTLLLYLPEREVKV